MSGTADSFRRTLALLALLAAVAPAFAKGGKGKDVEDPAETAFAAKYASDDGAEREAAIRSLSSVPEPLRVKILLERVLPVETRADLHADAVEILGGVKDVAARQVVVDAAKDAAKAGADVRVLCVQAIARWINEPVAHAAALALLGDKDVWVRSMAAYAIGEHRAPDGILPLVGLLDDPKWQARSAAINALSRLGDKTTLAPHLPKIADCLESSNGRQKDECARLLETLTGKKLGKDANLWRLWIQGGDAALPKEDAAAPKKPSGGYGDEEPRFYGMPVVSSRVVVILDISLSMNDPIRIDKDRLRRETSRRKAEVTGGPGDGKKDPKKPAAKDAPPPEDEGYDIPWWKIKTRLDLARYQAINLIAGLRPDQNFELITFSTEVHPWMGKLVPADQANKQKAIALIEGIKPEDQTNTWGAIAAAFELSEKDAKDPKGKLLGPDEIYLVTDGAPSKGDIIDPQQILDGTIQLWRTHQTKIHTIGIGIDLSFLRKMAQLTGGQTRMFPDEKESD
ncbi:MAG: hypothetical protein HMLKMBBP_02709 [Planctomycetes bacterium]|nr:hypothetical protein [Planctomycetota bacterium]